MTPDRARGTMRFRITALATLAAAAVLALTAVGLVVTQRRVLTDNLDESLQQEAAAIAEDWSTGQMPETLAPVGDDDAFAQLVDDEGRVLSTANAAGAPPLRFPATGNDDAGNDDAGVPTAEGDETRDDTTGDDDAGAPTAEGDENRGDADEEGSVRTVDGAPTGEEDAFRVVTRTVDGPLGEALLHVGAPLDDIDETTALLTRSLAVAVPAVTLLLAALVWWLVGRTLRPVEAMRREAAAIDGADLERRVPVPAGDDEIARLARTLNAMLGRIDDAARRQQRFVADASHELRSPLARIRTELEVDLAHPTGADPAATSRSVLQETIGMQALVDDLLLLARSDAGAATTPRVAAVDLDDLVARQVQRLRADTRLRVDASAVGAVQVVGDRARLERALANVVDNAARHAASTVGISLAAHDGMAVLAVTDDGPGIPPERRDEVFERFTRLDGARAASTGGTGLGLAIARDIVEAHGGTIAVDPGHHPGAQVVITLPATAP